MPVAMPADAKVVLRFQEKQTLCCHPQNSGEKSVLRKRWACTNTRYAKLPLKSFILVEYPGLQVNTGYALEAQLPNELDLCVIQESVAETQS